MLRKPHVRSSPAFSIALFPKSLALAAIGFLSLEAAVALSDEPGGVVKAVSPGVEKVDFDLRLTEIVAGIRASLGSSSEETSTVPQFKPVVRSETPAKAPEDSRVFRATGLTLADMAQQAVSAPPKQAGDRSSHRLGQNRAPSQLSLGDLMPTSTTASGRLAREAATDFASRYGKRPSARTAPRFAATGLAFPDPREPVGTGNLGRDDRNAWRYSESASLARFLGGIDRMPNNTRVRQGAMPVSLDQVLRNSGTSERPQFRIWSRAQGASPGFSYADESFAGNRLTPLSTRTRQGVLGGESRRRAVMDELRDMFEPAR